MSSSSSSSSSKTKTKTLPAVMAQLQANHNNNNDYDYITNTDTQTSTNLLSFNPQPAPPGKRRKIGGGDDGNGAPSTSAFRSRISGIVSRNKKRAGIEEKENENENENENEGGRGVGGQSRLHEYFGWGEESRGGVGDDVSKLVEGVTGKKGLDDEEDGEEVEEEEDEEEEGNNFASMVNAVVQVGAPSSGGLGWIDVIGSGGGGVRKLSRVKEKRRKELEVEEEGEKEERPGSDGETEDVSTPSKKRRKTATIDSSIPEDSQRTTTLFEKEHVVQGEDEIAQLATPESCSDDEPVQQMLNDEEHDHDDEDKFVSPNHHEKPQSSPISQQDITPPTPIDPASPAPRTSPPPPAINHESDSGSMVPVDSDEDHNRKRISKTYIITPETSDAYTNILNSTIQSVTTRDIALPKDKFPPLPSSYVLASYWTSDEKHRFFNALGRFGRHDIPSLAAGVGTKSQVECRAYVKALQEGLEDAKHSPEMAEALIAYEDIPAAVELSNTLVSFLDEHANVLESEANLDEALEEQLIYGKDMWILDEALAARIDEHWATSTSSSSSTKSFTPPPQTELLRAHTFLRLSERFFMNKPTPINNSTPQNQPELRLTTLLDFYNLAKTLTERLVQSSIFTAKCRINAGGGNHPALPVITHSDVRAATDLLGLSDPKEYEDSHNRMSGRQRLFWVGMPRRQGLTVMRGYGHQRMSLREVEKALVMPYVRGEYAMSVEERQKKPGVDGRLPRKWCHGKMEGALMDGGGDVESEDDDDEEEEESGSESESDSGSADSSTSTSASSTSDSDSDSDDDTPLDAHTNYKDILASQAAERELWKVLLPKGTTPPPSPSPPSSRSPSPSSSPSLGSGDEEEETMELWDEEFPYYTSWRNLKSVPYVPDTDDGHGEGEEQEDGMYSGGGGGGGGNDDRAGRESSAEVARDVSKIRKRKKKGKGREGGGEAARKRPRREDTGVGKSVGSDSQDEDGDVDHHHHKKLPHQRQIFPTTTATIQLKPKPKPKPATPKHIRSSTSKSTTHTTSTTKLKSKSKSKSQTPQPQPHPQPQRRSSSSSSSSPSPSPSSTRPFGFGNMFNNDNNDDDDDLGSDAPYHHHYDHNVSSGSRKSKSNSKSSRKSAPAPPHERPSRARVPIQRLGTLVSTVDAVDALLEDSGTGGGEGDGEGGGGGGGKGG